MVNAKMLIGILNNLHQKTDRSDQEHPENRRKWLWKFSFEAQKNREANNYKLWHDGFHPVILDTLQKNRTAFTLYTSC
jgi:hypothetical protein